MVELFTAMESDRLIFWIADVEGGIGKTTFAKFAEVYRNAAYVGQGEARDMAYIVQKKFEVFKCKHLVVDRPRTAGKDFDIKQLITFVEQVKNDVIFSPKYQSDMVYIVCLIVMIISNEYPPEELLTPDRWYVGVCIGICIDLTLYHLLLGVLWHNMRNI